MSRLENRVPPPLVAVLFGAGMAAAAVLFPWAVVSFPGQEVAAAWLAAAGLGVIAASVLQFVRARTTVNPLHPEAASALVTGGVFRLTRNPMYLGMALILAGWACWLGSVPGALLLAGFVVCINRYQIAPEERALRARFGAEFEAYAERARRWL